MQVAGSVAEKLNAAVRYGSWKPAGGDEISSVAAGFGYSITEGAVLKGEYRTNSETPNVYNDVFTAQIVVSF